MVQTVRRVDAGILHGKDVVGTFDGGDISSDGGVMLVEQAECRLGVIAKLASVVADDRDPTNILHSVEEMLRRRVFQIACGYEDCNDADDLRFDPVFKSAVGRLPQSDPDLASQPTLSRLENSIGRTELYRMSEVLVEAFVSSQNATPKQVIIGSDATDDPAHGQQQLAGFHGYYGGKALEFADGANIHMSTATCR